MTTGLGAWATTIAGVVLLVSAGPARAQAHVHTPASSAPGWSVTFDGRVYLNFNIQERKYTDFHQAESQNWFMLSAGRNLGRGRLTVTGMTSLEAYTLRAYGSAQVFQTGETYQGAALVDYQHPHDVVMAASARWEMPAGAWRWIVDGGAVGSPAIGPAPFMHRASAEFNPTSPLAHHSLDSTHITHGVATVGLARGKVTVEASAFNGREPDEDRLRVEFGPIDSYAARVQWASEHWAAQVSGGYFKFPDPTEFTDHNRVTASASYLGAWRARPLAVTLAFALDRETAFDLTAPAWLAEGSWRVAARDHLYARAEWLKKDILTRGGYDPPGFVHPHVLSRIGALTTGYARDLARWRGGALTAGADATVYARDPNLADTYGHPFSAHVFLRYGVR